MNRVPRRIGRYAILRGLPAGGMAQVYVARKDGRTDLCALKRMRIGLSDNPIITERFIREAQVAALLDHPHIAKVFEASVEEESLCMAVELIRGKDLSAIAHDLARRKVRIPFGITIAVMLRVLDALDYAHRFIDQAGRHLEIVHRDVGPRNVMIGLDGSVKIIDFGLAKADFGRSLTASGVLLGTPRYMSPEQARGEEVDARADVYTVAITLYELLAGRAVVTDHEPIDALRSVLENKIAPLSEIEPRVPKELAHVLEKALQKDRKKRHASAREFKDEIVRATKKSPIASTELIAAFMKKHFPELELLEKEVSEDSAPSSEADTVVVTATDPLAFEPSETPTAEEVPAVVAHRSIDLALPPPRPKVRIERASRWMGLAVLLVIVAIVMLGLVAYQMAVGGP